MTTLPKQVKIVEVGPRDGLQNEKKVVSSDVKIEFINRLSQTGLHNIEVTSFVSPEWVPQLADNSNVFTAIKKNPGICYSVLVPNLKGLQQAIDAKVSDIAIFTAASDSFTKKNINCTIEESLHRYQDVIREAQNHNINIRAYISCAIACPYEGAIDPAKVAKLAQFLHQAGCYEISLGDTIGVATPGQVSVLIEKVSAVVPLKNIAVHFHDTYGQAIANIYASLQMGITTIDSSVAGLGGCPYAKGATGNVATDDVVYLLDGLGIQSGIDLNKLVATGNYICQQLGQENRSKVARAKSS